MDMNYSGQNIMRSQRIYRRQDSRFFSKTKEKIFFSFKLQYFSCITSLTLKALLSFLIRSSLVHSLFNFFSFLKNFKVTCTLHSSSAKRCTKAVLASQLLLLSPCCPSLSTQSILRRGHNFLEGICKGVGNVQWKNVTGLV